MPADLHIHTTASDGHLSPQEIIDQAILSNLNCIAITDHDTVDGLLELDRSGYLAGKPLNLIPGIEFSTDLPQYEVHILGYRIDIFNQTLRQQLSVLVGDRQERVKETLRKLAALGYSIKYEQVVKSAGAATAIGRPHIARVLVEKGYFPTITAVFNALLHKNGPAYVPHTKLDYPTVLNIIRQAGGFSVLAHPGLIGDDRIVQDIIAAGIDGIEVYHPRHNAAQTKKYRKLAKKHQLLITGGSDFHAIPGRFPEKLGIFTIPDPLIDQLCVQQQL